VTRTWYEFKNSAGKNGNETEVLLYDEIGGFGVSAAQFISELQQVPKENRLVLRIHSPGGSVLDGNAIFTALRNWPGGVTTHIDGLAASMASVIAIAGDPVQMSGNGILMVHRVSAGASGNADDLRKMADVADKIEETVIKAYVGKTGLSRKRITALMDEETWMTASEALGLGFIDEITGDLKMAAHFDLTNFKNSAQLTAAIEAMSKPTITELEEKIVGLQLTISDSVTASEELTATHGAAIEAKDATISTLEATAEEFVKTTAAARDAHALVVEAKDAEIKTLTGSVETLTAEAKSSDVKAREIAARFGVNLPAKDFKAGGTLVGTGTATSMTRDEFAPLSASAKRAFFKAGGKLTD
jgi:ATP-dependent protease ClpP protease subunit